VFVDVLKELPATLMLRPFDFNTLAVKAYELAADEQLVEAAPASLMIVVVGLIPVLILNKAINRRRQRI
ncbi:MAG: iron ABC transporter permease, partial [Pseudomonadales bacterium]